MSMASTNELSRDEHFDRRSVLRFGALSTLAALMRCMPLVAQKQSAIRVVDLIPDLLRFLRTNTASDPGSAHAFRSEVIGRNADLYDAFVGTRNDENLETYLQTVRPLVSTMAALDEQIRSRVPQTFRRFHDHFPDFVWTGPLFVMANLFGFDGGGGQLNNRDVLVFGLDTIAKQYGANADLSVLISHEAFHIYHDQFHPEWSNALRGKDTPLYRLVWKEGLAVFVRGQLNPSAKESDLLLSGTLQSECDRQFSALCASLRNVLDTTDRENFMLWMSGSKRVASITPRAGYYLGQRAVAVTSKGLSASQMARMDDQAIRAALISFLKKHTQEG